jgi:hypothetical protein
MDTNKPTNKDLDTKAMNGVDKHLASLTSIMIGGTAYTGPALKAVFQADIDAINAADTARTQWKDLLVTAKAARTTAVRARQALKTYLIGLYGPSAVGILEDFGISPPKSPGRKTAKAKALAVDKSAATRAARHTMGKNQKMSVKGTVTPVSPPAPAGEPPVTAPPAASVPPQGTSGGTPRAS